MNRSHKHAEIPELEQIGNVIISHGVLRVTDTSPENKKCSEHGAVSIPRKTPGPSRDDIWEK
jgi:hypothetical protein